MEIRTQQEASEPAPSPVRLNAHELAVLDAIRATPFGTIEVVLHQARIVQVVKTEKVRLEPTA